MTWRATTLGELVRIEHGFAFKGEFFVDSGRQIVLTPGNFHEEGGFRARPGKDRYYSGEFPERYVLERHALIVAMTEQGEGLLGSAALVPYAETYLHNQRIGRVKERRELADRRFLYYLFNTDHVRQQIRNSSSGTKVRHTSPERMYSAEVKVPDVESQRKIAAILSAYDDLIANNQRRIALLESMAEEIYREWFVRMRFPDHRKVPRVKGLPSSWSLKPFREFCVLKRGYDLPDSSMLPGRYPVIASTSIKGFHNEFKVKPPVITTGRSGSLGTVLLVNKESWPLNTALYVKDFCGNSPFLIFYTLRSLKLETFNVGAGVPTLNRNHLSSLGIAVPDAALQRRFDAILGPMNAQASALTATNESLAAQRDALLPRLISGKLKVDHLDIQLTPAMREKVTA